MQLIWQTRGGSQPANQASPSGDVCTDFQITGIRARAIDENDKVATESDVLPCSLHSVQLTRIKAGTGYHLEVEGLINDQVQWFGQKSDIEVIAGQSTDLIVVEMAYQGAPQSPPTATVVPTDGATNVNTNTAITIQFDKAVVAASLNADSILVQNGGSPVSGSIAYNDTTYKAVFQPDENLAVASTYTVTVTTEVMDITGQHMAQDVTNQFSTTTVWFVDGVRSSSGSGNSWAEAFNTIADAVTDADVANGHQIWVKAGTYKLNNQIALNKSVTLLGGFDGTETQPDQRDWVNQTTTIDGQGNGRCFYISSPAIVDGFTMTGGSVANQSSPEGGAMYIDGVNPQIKNCIFRANLAGPSDGYGGAIFIDAGDPLINKCMFIDNDANSGVEGYGGAIYNKQGGPTISDCTFKDNVSSLGFGNFGGAIYNENAKSSTLILDCLFKSNSAGGEVGRGGAIYNGGSTGSPVQISGCRFVGNSSGGLSGYGGAIYNSNSSASIQNCIFDANRAGGQNSAYGGAISSSGSSPAITNCTFAYNRTVVGVGSNAIGGAVASQNNSTVTITNSIIWDNTALEVYDDATSISTVSYCIIDPAIASGSNNLDKRPRLAEDLHLRSDSPGIGKADNGAAPAADMDGETRPQGAQADMGADEFLDTDSDLLPDYWETLYGVGNAQGDRDGDLVSNLAEYNLGTDPKRSNEAANADDRGSVRSDGYHQTSDSGTPTGAVGSFDYRSYFVFDVSGVGNTVTAAAVRLELAGYNSNDVPETFQIWNVSATAADLAVDRAQNSQQGQAIYSDLGSGTPYAEFAPTPSDGSTVLDIRLSTDAISAINTARSGSGDFIIGIRLNKEDVGHILFSNANETRVHQLVLVEE